MKRNTKRSDCPMHCALNVLGDRWTLVIVRDLLFMGRGTFTELLNSPEKIATNTLSSRLAKLLDHGIIEQSEQSLCYRLTDKGFDLAPVLMELAAWSEKYDGSVISTSEAYQKYREDPLSFIDELKANKRLG